MPILYIFSNSLKALNFLAEAGETLVDCCQIYDVPLISHRALEKLKVLYKQNLYHYSVLKVQFGQNIAQFYFSLVDHWFPELGTDMLF